jgi:hypothetical protein
MTRRGANPRRRRIVTVVVASLAVIIVVAGGSAAYFGLQPASTAHRSAGHAKNQTPPIASTIDPNDTSVSPAQRRSAAIAGATTSFDAVIKADTAVLAKPSGKLPDISDYAAGFVAGELQATQEDRKAEGYTQVGSPRITSVTASKVDLTSSPPTVTLDVCIDSSHIDVLDSAGHSLASSLYESKTPVLNVYGAEWLDNTWKLTTHSIPTKGKCS